eukprot:TRINITY_DN315_c0_g2_i2.p1 TRINITY_DN315_c0_g2~~TRINITY_DN315_c0_g2_i2.p1  ORF type:complete len:423 (-),score=117.17 TRINITY_DN315_c0_g2_i2:17-1285(-)
MNVNDVEQSFYRLKKIKFKETIVPIVLQNLNGPCPLLAITNILLLRGHISIHEDKSFVSPDELLSLVGDFILHSNSEANEEMRQNFELSMADAMEVLPKTLFGLDVNVKFRSITAFEYTKEMVIFDVCKIRLVHGWLPDPNADLDLFNLLHNISYNQLVEKQINLEDRLDNIKIDSPPQPTTTTSPITTTSTTSTTSTSTTIEPIQRAQSMSPNSYDKWKKGQDKLNTLTHEGLLAEKFLNETASQISNYGLSSLQSGLYEEELCVLFRNNHFSTLYKHDGYLLDLVTDLGYSSENVVWERLSQIDGNTVFLNSDFTMYQPSTPTFHAYASSANGDANLAVYEMQSEALQHDEDFALAMRLQEEENKKQVKTKKIRSTTHPLGNNTTTPSDQDITSEKKHKFRKHKNQQSSDHDHDDKCILQ